MLEPGEAWGRDLERLRFDAQAVDRELASDLGAGFQRFCFELLRRRHPRLRRYPAAGRDGGIDLIEDGEEGRGVFECKRIGEDGLDAARARWRAVARNLRAHLPARSQSQYAPWWETSPPIRRYTLCVSSTLANQAQHDELEREIRQLFAELAEGHEHLRHLAQVEVEVLHWPDLMAELEASPSLLFKWFPQARPLGLVPIDRPRSASLFSSFLDSSHLGYYSRDRHIAEHGRPKHVRVESEMDMLARLEETLGLIVTGSGGHGKTRLVQELGVLAQQQDWCVLRVAGPWRQESLARLAGMVAPSTPVLLLLDYIEMQQGFGDVVNDLVAIHDTYDLRIRYVANCRSSFYPQVAHLPQHAEIPLAPDHGIEWFREFRHCVVRHILDTGGVGIEAKTLQVCRDVPVLAVFLVYLAASGRDEDLGQLLEEKDFGKWVRRRLEISFGGIEGHEVAPVVAQFPVREETAPRLAPVEVLSTLEKDGWIEQQPVVDSDQGEREWSVVHDVLADQLLVSWLAERGSFAGGEVERVLALALENGTLASFLSALQRIRDHPEVEGIPFSALVRDGFARDPAAWLAQVPNLLGTSLLDLEDSVSVLESNRELWLEHLARPSVRQQIGWLARELSRDPQSPPALAILDWLQRSLDVEETDYLLRSGLLLSPATTAARAKAWINARPGDFSTHFVITAWLRADLPPDPIVSSILTWLEAHGDHPRAWHVLARWLGSTTDRELIDEHVLRWMESNHTIPQGASMVFHTWLKRGADVEDATPYVIGWLEENIGSYHGSYVLGTWIEAGADLELARPYLERWLENPGHPFEACFVHLSWLNRGGDLEVVREHLEACLDLHAGKDGVWYLIDLFVRAVPKTPELAERLLREWEVSTTESGFGQVLHGWLLSGGSPDLLQPHLENWLATYGETMEAGGVYAAWMAQAELPREVRAAAIRWFLAYPTEVQAGYLSKHLVEEEEIDLDALKAILLWCKTFPSHEDALWRFTQLKANLYRPEVAREVLAAAEAILESHLAQDKLTVLETTQLTSLCALLVCGRPFQTGVDANLCDLFMLEYMRHPMSFEHGDVKLVNAERPGLIRRILSLVLRGWLDVETEAGALRRLFAWVETWDEPDRAEARECIAMVAAVHPLGDALDSDDLAASAEGAP